MPLLNALYGISCFVSLVNTIFLHKYVLIISEINWVLNVDYLQVAN